MAREGDGLVLGVVRCVEKIEERGVDQFSAFDRHPVFVPSDNFDSGIV